MKPKPRTFWKVSDGPVPHNSVNYDLRHKGKLVAWVNVNGTAFETNIIGERAEGPTFSSLEDAQAYCTASVLLKEDDHE